MARIVLAMSGGVDSSVAAHVLKNSGHDVIGVFMRHGSPPLLCDFGSTETAHSLAVLPARMDHKQGCCTASDAEDARRVADDLQIPFYALNLQADFDRIVDYFTDEYSAGRTPNPCVMCNNWIKFGRLFDYANSVGAEYVATGHYARLESPPDQTTRLRRGIDYDKDQSYVLFGIDRGMLTRMLLPIGQYRKSEVRAMATEMGLRVADKRDSQEICFVAAGRHAEHVAARNPADRSGRLITTDGQVVGRHNGIERFTIGQRKGLGVAFGQPRYVVRIDSASCDVVIGEQHELQRTSITANRLNWLVDPPAGWFSCLVQIRYNSEAHPAQARQRSPEQLEVQLDQPCTGVAPGQALVCYHDDIVLGGGWIE
ncbi:MAG: tRNA 2-thiouridine(34) synthase MnmA [Pirellulaceae bacterium]